mmetsp:Transcript_20251/g.19199  ORF Transcript_20251/g.19199 Transcript_20251/m.19199 type:complete len:90 (-) Transcript_20251:2757-3026(-)
MKYKANNLSVCLYVGLECPEYFTVSEEGDNCVPDLYECPVGFSMNEAETSCIPTDNYPIPFPFLIFSAIMASMVGAIKWKEKAKEKRDK